MKNSNIEIRISQSLMAIGLCVLASFLVTYSAARGAEDPDYFYAEAEAVLWAVDGQEEKFKELIQREDGLTGGIESIGYDRNLGGDWLLNFTGRLVAERDAAASLVLKESDRWKFDVGYQTFRSYQNNAVESYSFGPQDNQLARSIELDRGRTRMRAEMNQPGLPVIQVGYEQRTQSGHRLLLERGPVDFFSLRNLPLFQEVDTDEHVASLAIRHTIAGLDVSFKQALNFFRGSLIWTQNQFETGLGTRQAEERRERPDTFVSMSSLEVSKNFMDKLFLSLGYRFHKTDGEGEFNKSVADPVGGSMELNGGSDVNIDNHSISLGIRYLPLEYLTLTGELAYQNLEKRGRSSNLFRTPLDVLILSEKSKSNIDDRGIEGNLSIQFSAIPRATLDAGVEVSRIQRTYDEQFASGRGFLDDFILDSDADLARTGYWARLRVRPMSFIHVSARYRWDRLAVDFEDDPVRGRGPVPGINDRSNRRGRTEVQIRLTPLPTLAAILTYKDERSKFFTFAGDPDEIANGHARTYGAGLMLMPLSGITFSTQYTYQDYWANTRASSLPQNVPYESLVHTWFNGLEIALRARTKLFLDSQLSTTKGQGQNAGGDGSLGSMSLDWTLQSYGVAVEHALTERAAIKASFRYMDFDAEENYNHDDFKAYMFFVRLRIEI